MSGATLSGVVPFAELGRDDVATAGGKGASLGELLRAGIRVPDGFVVTTDAFRQVVERVDPGGVARDALAAVDADDAGAVAAQAARLRELFVAAPLPDGLAHAVAAAYDALSGGAGYEPVAVRSSATGEDSAEASYAGLQDTHLWVRGRAALLDRLRECWASLYSVEAVTYRLRRGLHEVGGPAMAVVVQRMVDSRSSGVMFTRSPLTGDRSVVCVDAAWGLGSAVVGGEVTPDSFVISKVTGEITKRTVATKDVWHRPDEAGSGVVAGPVPPELRERPSVSDDELAELVATARAVEAHYGAPQDIEWAISASAPAGENVFLLQSRPETTHSDEHPAAAAAPASALDHVAAMLLGRAAGTGTGTGRS